MSDIRPETYWIYLQSVLGIASRKMMAVLEVFGSAKGFFDAPFSEKQRCGLFSSGELRKIKQTYIASAIKTVEKCEHLGYDIITPDDASYPKRLIHIIDPPAVLYVSGTFPENIDDEVAIAMVGTRKASNHGRAIAYELSKRLSKAGAIIVSGGALGIDSSSHTGAIAAGGMTIAVLGCGINYNYLAQNEELRRDISKHGALVSEYPPDAPSSPYTFPVRNRIISGLCLGTIVVEATARSGSLITVNHALEQGRDVFVIPGEVSSPQYIGSNRLIRDGAKAISSPLHVLEEYTHLYPHRLNLDGAEIPLAGETFEQEAPGTDEKEDIIKASSEPEKPFSRPSMPDGLSDSAQAIFSAFERAQMQTDELISKSRLSSTDALVALTELEIIGIITALPGGRYKLN